MWNMRQLALVGAIMTVGIVTGALYTSMTDVKQTLTISDGKPTVEDKLAMANRAIEMVKADPKTAAITNVGGAIFYSKVSESTQYNIVLVNGTQGSSHGTNVVISGNTFLIEHVDTSKDNTSYSAFVTIRYPDDSGYAITVNLSEGIVEEAKKAVWENDGKVFRLMP